MPEKKSNEEWELYIKTEWGKKPYSKQSNYEEWEEWLINEKRKKNRDYLLYGVIFLCLTIPPVGIALLFIGLWYENKYPNPHLRLKPCKPNDFDDYKKVKNIMQHNNKYKLKKITG